MSMKKQSLVKKQLTAQRCEKNHLTLQPHCRSCRTLQTQWYEYIKESGFQDIEKKTHQNDKGSTSDFRSRVDAKSVDAYQAKLNYFLWASDMASNGVFRDKRDKTIWEAHADGVSRRKIAPKVDLEHSYISRKISQIKSYLKNQSLDLNTICQGSMSMSIGIA